MGYLLASRSCWCSSPNKGSCHFSTSLFFSQGQYVDGLRSSLVIHPEQEVYSYDEEFTVVIGDWYHEQQPVLLKQFINIKNPAGAEPIPGQLSTPFIQLFSDTPF